MSTPASINRHPLHPMLVVFPIGLWIFSFIADLIYVLGDHVPVWDEIAFYTMAGGVIGALLAALPGLVDLLSIRERQAKRVAITHMSLNLVVVALFATNLWLRTRQDAGAALPIVLSAVGIAILGVSGWLGGDLVYRHGVGVDLVPDSIEAHATAASASLGPWDHRHADRRIRTSDRRMATAG